MRFIADAPSLGVEVIDAAKPGDSDDSGVQEDIETLKTLRRFSKFIPLNKNRNRDPNYDPNVGDDLLPGEIRLTYKFTEFNHYPFRKLRLHLCKALGYSTETNFRIIAQGYKKAREPLPKGERAVRNVRAKPALSQPGATGEYKIGLVDEEETEAETLKVLDFSIGRISRRTSLRRKSSVSSKNITPSLLEPPAAATLAQKLQEKKTQKSRESTPLPPAEPEKTEDGREIFNLTKWYCKIRVDDTEEYVHTCCLGNISKLGVRYFLKDVISGETYDSPMFRFDE